MGLYDNIKAVCKKQGISVNSLENKLGITRSYLSKWNTVIPSIAMVKEVADGLNVSLDELTKGIVFPKKGEKHE